MAVRNAVKKMNITSANKRNSNLQLSLLDGNFFTKQPNAFQEMCSVFGCDSTQPAWPDNFGQSLLKFLENEAPISTLSLFSGAGGLDIGFNDAGFNIFECVEIERKFCDTLLLNNGKEKTFSHDKVNCIDIREYIPNDLPQIDFIVGGPPCQTFSAAGRRANGVLGTTDDRGVLFKEYVRLLSQLEPKGFLFENVYGITGAQNGSAWQEILNEFSNVGYKLFYRILDAADYGVPQHRERLFIVGLKEGSYLFPRPTHGPDSPQSSYYSASQAILSVALTDKEAEEGLNGRYGHLLNDIPPGLNYSFYTEQMGHPNPVFAWRSKFSDFLYKADPYTPVRTIKAQGGQYTGPFHWNNRTFSTAEYKRLQTFPDNYEISGNKQTQLHQIGNSVPPQLARILAMSIRHQVFDTDFGFDIPYLNEFEELGFRKRKRLLTKQYQEKAKLAIGKLQSNILVISPTSHKYFATLSDKFDFRTSEKESSDFYVSIEWSSKLKITIHDSTTTDPANDRECFFSIRVLPEYENWGLSVDEIQVDCFSAKPLSYTLAWKAIENELIRNNIKADLVQLCGYYQYTPKIKCTLIRADGNEHISFLKSVVNGNITRRMISLDSLADEWNISTDEVLDYAQQMRRLGYEIRNSQTNPQIEQDHWLIPYAFPTLTPQSVQLRKSLARYNMKEEHLDVYKNRSVLHSKDTSITFLEGKQSEDAKKRYEAIVMSFDAGFYQKAMEDIPTILMQDSLSEAHKNLIKSLVDGLTSEVGRALVGLSCLQLAIKSISPEQSIRLHKGGQRQSGFSWQEGISMRTLDNRYNTPFLRGYGLLNMNKDGIMMTRSLAENYPYSRLYKAELRGPVAHWISIVEALEDNSLPPYPSLCYLLSMLKNRSDVFTKKADAMIESAHQIKNLTPQKVQNALTVFFTTTSYSARAFEVVIHCFMQALHGLKLADGVLVPLSQMRSANKKHGNVGDIELKQGNMIIESWDAKYGKPYLRDELEELHDKLQHHPNVEVAGFIVNSEVNRATDIVSRAEELSIIHHCEIMLLSFSEWLEMKLNEISNDKLPLVAQHWLIAVVESFGQKRSDLAPIDEPCDQWIDDLSKAIMDL